MKKIYDDIKIEFNFEISDQFIIIIIKNYNATYKASQLLNKSEAYDKIYLSS